MHTRTVLLAFTLLAISLGSTAGAEADSPAGGAAAGSFVLRMPGIASDTSTGQTFDPGVSASGARFCRYLPGASPVATLGPAAPDPPTPGKPAPPNTPASSESTAKQLAVFGELRTAVANKYVDPLFNGYDWNTITASYEAKIRAGLTDANFHELMKQLINELGDGHSRYQSAEEVADENAKLALGEKYAGIGVLFQPLPQGRGTIVAVFPGSGAEAAGLRPHDLILDVNGGPAHFEDGSPSPLRGPAGTTVNVRVQRGGGTPFVAIIVRKAITAVAPVDSCLVAGTRIGYVFIPTLFDNSITTQVREALQKLMAGGPLTGLIIDNRLNGGGLEAMAKGVLGFFTSGAQGAYVSRTGSTPFVITPEAIGNSQTVPLVVLVGEGTASFGEITSGILGQAGRAKIVGTTTDGNVELLQATTFVDGSRIYLAMITFQPNGLAPGIWENTGIVPDFTVNGLWHEYTELDDPALARAVEVLTPP